MGPIRVRQSHRAAATLDPSGPGPCRPETAAIAVVATLAIFALAVALFVTERLRVDVVSLLVLVLILVAGPLSPADALAGFASDAPLTIAAMFVLTSGLARCGALDLAGSILARLARRGLGLTLLLLMAVAAVSSWFVNNTAVVAMLIPVVLSVSRSVGLSPSRLLMPLSFAAMFGGVCTVIGTSTNLIVSGIAAQHGQPAFGMFEQMPLGLAMLGAGLLYMQLAGTRLIPDRRPPGDLPETFDVGRYLMQVRVPSGSPLVGASVASVPTKLDVDVLAVTREDDHVDLPRSDFVLRAGDVLAIRFGLDAIAELRDSLGVIPVAAADGLVSYDGGALVEAVVPPDSPLYGRTLREAQLRSRLGCTALAIRHHGQVVHRDLREHRFAAGDTLLLALRKEQVPRIRRDPSLVVISERDVPDVGRVRLTTSVAIMASVVALSALGIAPIVVTAMAGATLMVLSRCLTIDQAYQAIEWRVIVLIGGVLALGKAMEESGAATLLARGMLGALGELGPLVVLSALYLLTSLLTEAMSNNATAALLAPIALQLADAQGVDPRAYLMAVAFAASASFMTPVGYQTNTLIYGPGSYRFSDFVRVGGPLNLIFWIAATLLIPSIWPLDPVGPGAVR